MKTKSTSGLVTVEHLLYASDETLGAFLLLTHAAFAGINAAEAIIGEIRPLHKSDEKFRPIALLEISHKLVTATIASRLSSLLFKHKLVDPSHFGFIQGGSVSIPIRILTTLYERARAEHTKTGDGNDCHAGLLDLVSAFDNVSHALLEAAFARIGAPQPSATGFVTSSTTNAGSSLRRAVPDHHTNPSSLKAAYPKDAPAAQSFSLCTSTFP